MEAGFFTTMAFVRTQLENCSPYRVSMCAPDPMSSPFPSTLADGPIPCRLLRTAIASALFSIYCGRYRLPWQAIDTTYSCCGNRNVISTQDRCVDESLFRFATLRGVRTDVLARRPIGLESPETWKWLLKFTEGKLLVFDQPDLMFREVNAASMSSLLNCQLLDCSSTNHCSTVS